MISKAAVVILLLSWIVFGCTENNSADKGDHSALSPQELEALANCLIREGWVMYGSNTCRSCRAQRKVFGDAFSRIAEIECNPHAAQSQSRLCIERQIIKFPTWLLEKNGKPLKRVEGFHPPAALASLSGCIITPRQQAGPEKSAETP